VFTNVLTEFETLENEFGGTISPQEDPAPPAPGVSDTGTPASGPNVEPPETGFHKEEFGTIWSALL
jgi:hypothetical protein